MGEPVLPESLVVGADVTERATALLFVIRSLEGENARPWHLQEAVRESEGLVKDAIFATVMIVGAVLEITIAAVFRVGARLCLVPLVVVLTLKPAVAVRAGKTRLAPRLVNGDILGCHHFPILANLTRVAVYVGLASEVGPCVRVDASFFLMVLVGVGTPDRLVVEAVEVCVALKLFD